MRLRIFSGEREVKWRSRYPARLLDEDRHQARNYEYHERTALQRTVFGIRIRHGVPIRASHGMEWNIPTRNIIIFNIGWSHDVRIHTYIPTGRTDIFSLSFLFSSSLSCYPCIYVSARARPS
jgi:hypothetical protein